MMFALTVCLSAQTHDGTESPKKVLLPLLKCGDHVRIALQGNRLVVGRLSLNNNDSIGIRRRGNDYHTYPRTEVLRIQKIKNHLVVGAFVGLGIGLILARVQFVGDEQSYDTYRDAPSAGSLRIIGIGFFTILGGFIGNGMHSYRTIPITAVSLCDSANY
jgi:hypothetical protein